MRADFPLQTALTVKMATPDGKRECGHGVLYSALDFNCHANSVKYLQWVVDTLPLEVLREKRFARTDINFLREVHYGERLRIFACGADEPLFEIRNGSGEAVCRLAFELV